MDNPSTFFGTLLVTVAIIIGLGVVFYLGCLIHPIIGLTVIALCFAIIGTELLKNAALFFIDNLKELPVGNGKYKLKAECSLEEFINKFIDYIEQ